MRLDFSSEDIVYRNRGTDEEQTLITVWMKLISSEMKEFGPIPLTFRTRPSKAGDPFRWVNLIGIGGRPVGTVEQNGVAILTALQPCEGLLQVTMTQ